MSVIDAVRDYIADYAGLEAGAPVWVGYLGSTPVEYSVLPIAGEKVLEHYVNGGSVRQFPFVFQSAKSTADDLERLETMGFFEEFADWLEDQTEDEDLPSLDSGKTALSIEAVGWGYLYEQGESETGIYQINCTLTYKQDAA